MKDVICGIYNIYNIILPNLLTSYLKNLQSKAANYLVILQGKITIKFMSSRKILPRKQESHGHANYQLSPLFYVIHRMRHVNNIPTMQFSTVSSRNNQSKLYTLAH